MLATLIGRLKDYFAFAQRHGLRVGRIGGTEVWFHWTLLAVLAVHSLVHLVSRDGHAAPAGYLVVYLVTLPLCVLVHELGHAWLSFREGGGAERLVLLPVGGLEACDAPSSPRSHLRVALGGPLASATVLATAAAACGLAGWPLLPGADDVAESSISRLALQYIVLWNVLLLIVNVLPIYPLDGGRALRAILWGRLESHSQATVVTLQISRIVAILGIAAAIAILFWLVTEERPAALAHPLANHLVLGLFIASFLHFYEARRIQLQLEYGYEDDEQGIFGYDFSQGYTSLAKSLPAVEVRSSPRERRRQQARRQAEGQKVQRELEMRRRVDDILEKIHSHGMESLSRGEQRFLRRASRHFRRSAAPSDG